MMKMSPRPLARSTKNNVDAGDRSKIGSLDHLTPEECAHILDVMRRDQELWDQSDEHISSREGSDGEMSDDDDLDSKHRKFNEKCCIRCCSPFNETLIKKIVCHSCKFYVCQNCATLNSHTRCWICKYCQHSIPVHPPPQVELYKGLKRRCRQFQSAKLLKSFYKARRDSDSENENDSGYVPSLSAASSWECSLQQQRKLPLDLTNLEEESSLDTTALKVREHIEDIVEKYLEDTLDSAPLDNVYNHPEYERVFLKYHGALRELLIQLSNSLQMAISNQPLENDETPSTIHSSLQTTVKELTEEAMRLPKMNEVDSYSPATSSDEDDIANQSYEAILATAIINKAIDSFQKGLQGSNYSDDFGSVDYEHFGTSHNGCSFDTETADDEFSWGRSFSGRRSPIEIKIEEQIEEVTTTIHDSDSGDEFGRLSTSREPKVTRTLFRKEGHMPELDNLYAGLGLAESHRVPFPELGADIVAADYPHPEVGAEAINYGVLMSSVESWEENWLFKKKKKVTPFKNSLGNVVIGDDPVAMLVPNPHMEVKVKVGERDIDELSEMSDGNSASSLDDFEAEMQDAEIVDEESEDDTIQGYTAKTQGFNERQIPEVRVTPVEDTITVVKSQVLHKQPSKQMEKVQLVEQTVNDVPDGAIIDKSIRIPIFVPITNRKSKCNGISISLSSDVVNIIVGKVARIQCVVKATKPTEVAWFFGCELLANEGRYSIHSKGNEHHLEIYETDNGDSGTYSCFAYNDAEECWRDFKIVVKGQLKKYSLPLFLKNTENLSVKIGQPAAFSCKVIGVPEPKVTWYKNDKEIIPYGNVSIETKPQGEYILSLDSTSKHDCGKYTVIAENKLGRVSSSAILEVLDVGKRKHLMYQPRSISDDRDFPQLEQLESYSSEISIGKVGNHFEGEEMTDSAYLDKDRELTEESLYDVSPLSGTIAEREMRKWNNPVQLAHNPYSPENISQRLKQTKTLPSDVGNVKVLAKDKIVKDEEGNTGDVIKLNSDQKEKRLTRYGRDYYVPGGQQKWASPSGSRQNSTETTPEMERTILLNEAKEVKAKVPVPPVVNAAKLLEGLEGIAVRKSNTGGSDRNNLHLNLDRVDMPSSNFQKYGSVDRNFRNLNRAKKADQERRSSHEVTSGSLDPGLEGMVRAPSVQELAKKFNNSVPASPVTPTGTLPLARKVATPTLETKVNNTTQQRVPSPVPQPRIRTPSSASTVSASSVTDRFLPQTALNSEVLESWPNALDDFVVGSSRSVKQLTLKFLEEQMSDGGQSFLGAAVAPVKRVHSLTARSLTREFREAAKRNMPHVTNRNLSTQSDSDGSSMEKCSDGQDTPSPTPRRNLPRKENAAEEMDIIFASADENNSTCSSSSAFSSTNDKSPPSPVPKPRRNMAKSIETRAAEWDRKVQENGLDYLTADGIFPYMNMEAEDKVTYL